jgi:AhpD family alkylhydroperoxidase
MHSTLKVFQKRTYSVKSFATDIRHIMSSFLDRSSSRTGSDPLDPAFSERIMLAVTQVNDCRYCSYGHTIAALRAGVPQDELDAIKTGDFSAASQDELPALLFAQHYAAEDGQPGAEALEALNKTYGEARAARILLTIRMITLGNLLGNTFDALLSRLRGRRVLAGNALQEIAVLLLVILTMPLMLIAGLFGAIKRLFSRAAPL